MFVSYVLFYARTWKVKQPKIAPKIDKDCSRLHCMQIFSLKIVNKLLKIENVLITLTEDCAQIVDDCRCVYQRLILNWQRLRLLFLLPKIGIRLLKIATSISIAEDWN